MDFALRCPLLVAGASAKCEQIGQNAYHTTRVWPGIQKGALRPLLVAAVSGSLQRYVLVANVFNIVV